MHLPIRRLPSIAADLAWERWHARRVEPLSLAERAAFLGIRVLWPATYDWPPCEGFVGTLKDGFAALASVETVNLPQPYAGVVCIQVDVGDRQHPVAIDYSDYPVVNCACAEASLVYFKMQFDPSEPAPPNVVPGGYVPFNRRLYSYLDAVRTIRDRGPQRFDVYGRFGADFATDIRSRAVHLLREQRRFRYEGSLKTIRYSRYLREIARSKVVVNLPGNGDFCFRLVDYLAVGACIVSTPLRNQLPSPLEDGHHIVFCKQDLSDLVETCERLLANPVERDRLARASRAYFDQHLRYPELARHYLVRILGNVGEQQCPDRVSQSL